MPLLDDGLRARLPTLFGQEAEDEPWIYARLVLPGTSWVWYVLEGGPEGNAYWLKCFFSSDQEQVFGLFLLSTLEAIRSPSGNPVECDLAFIEGRLTDVVPAPDS